MSHLSGKYTYDFTRLEPKWDNSLETGINQMVIGMTCSFSGQDTFGNTTVTSKYIDGTTGWAESITYDYLNTNVQDICNTYASGQNWFYNLQAQVSGSIDHPVDVTGFNPTVTPDPHIVPTEPEEEAH